MTADPFSHPWLGAIFGDTEIADLIGAPAMLTNMLAVETAYARALGAVGQVDATRAEQAAIAIEAASIEPSDLSVGTARDGMPVPALIRILKRHLPEDLHQALHKGMTSQDVIDTGFVLALRSVLKVLEKRLAGLSSALDHLDQKFGSRQMGGRTRMQLALPISVSDRVRIWRDPITGLVADLMPVRQKLLQLQLGGPVGTRETLGPFADQISAHMAASLGLDDPKSAWHTDRRALVSLANWLSFVTGHLGKMGQDIALMAQQGVDDLKLSGGGASSAMPHKQNPIKAELLITLAAFNATQISGMHQTLVHEQERSGAMWTLEWMLMPGMLQATGRSMTTAVELVESIQTLGEA